MTASNRQGLVLMGVSATLIGVSLYLMASNNHRQDLSPKFLAPCAADERETELREEVARYVRQWRASSGKHQATIADELGLSQSHLSKIEQQRSSVSLDVLLRVLWKLQGDVQLTDDSTVEAYE